MAVKIVVVAVLATCAFAATAYAQRASSAARVLRCDEVDALRAAKPDALAPAERKRLEDFSRRCATAVDPAFMRRLRLSVEFPTPDAATRLQAWRDAFPQGPVSDTAERKPKEPR